MRRRTAPTSPLPDRLRVFDPAAWLRPGEDATDAVAVHYMARVRWLAELRERGAAVGVQAIGPAPRVGCGCRCSGCTAT